MRDQCSVQTFPVKSGFSRVCVREKERKKNGGRIARRRFNDSTAILCCLYAFTRRVPLQEIQKSRHLAPVRNNSRPTRDAQFFISPSLCEKQQRHANISRKTLPFFLAKIYFFPAPSAISISDSRRNLAAKRGNLERTHHYVKDATSLVLRRPTRAFLHSRATSPVNSRQLALSTNS